ncbi:MAG: Gfo/Idh/MocA family oxidoreductase [Clostridiales bacterium]|nr:Gfo/Idh/MocA family oxidoreductase [Clostridiales bacterium]
MKKYVLVGASGRGYNTYAKNMVKYFNKQARIVGMFDINTTRMNYINQQLGTEIPIFTDFDLMMVECKPDCAIITTVDAYHHEFIVKVLKYNCDVIVEKPLATDSKKVKAIKDAYQKSTNNITITFNYRFTPYVTAIKQLLTTNVIGEIHHVDFEYLLGRSHGSDYYRRWHRYMNKSGGLLVHKSTHHFDLVNWWLDKRPLSVSAHGSLEFYGENGKISGERCSTCIHNEKCEFYVDYINQDYFKQFYFDAEFEDGYHRDGCVFDKSIDIYDTMSVRVLYEKNTTLTYSLTAYNPYEGFKASILGTKGRIEIAEYHTGEHKDDKTYTINIYDINGNHIEKVINKSTGDHGGGDQLLLQMLFLDDIKDPLGHMASLQAGIDSAMIGISANESIISNKNIKISEL